MTFVLQVLVQGLELFPMARRSALNLFYYSLREFSQTKHLGRCVAMTATQLEKALSLGSGMPLFAWQGCRAGGAAQKT